MPTLLTHTAFQRMMTLGAEATSLPAVYSTACPLERFLGTVLLKRHLNKILRSDMQGRATLITDGVEAGSINWSVNYLRFKVVSSAACNMLEMSITPLSGTCPSYRSPRPSYRPPRPSYTNTWILSLVHGSVSVLDCLLYRSYRYLQS